MSFKGKAKKSREVTLKKTEIATALGIHHNTVANLLSRGTLEGTTLRDVCKYMYERGKIDGAFDVRDSVDQYIKEMPTYVNSPK
jgi:IS30 family transposase